MGAIFSTLLLSSYLANASTIFSTAAGTLDSSNEPLSASVTFTVQNCVIGHCDLLIGLTNSQANPNSSGQLISDVSFTLLNGLTALTAPGTLSNTISNGVGGPVTVETIANGSATTSTTTTLDRWNFTFDSGISAFHLDALGGGQPDHMIIGPGPYSNANASITNFNPSYLSTVVFEIDNFAGLTNSTTFGNVKLSFGTGPDTIVTLCTDCGGGGPQSVPEPMTFGLIGGGLGLIGLLRRRFAA